MNAKEVPFLKFFIVFQCWWRYKQPLFMLVISFTSNHCQ